MPIDTDILLIGVMVFITVVLFMYSVRLGRRRAKKDLKARIMGPTQEEQEQDFDQMVDSAMKESGENRSFFGRLQSELVKADVEITAREYYFILIGCCTVLYIFGLFVTRNVVTALFCAAPGAMGPKMWVRYLKARRADQFTDQLEKALMLAANTLRSGQTMIGAINAIADQMPDPIRTEFDKARKEIQVGATSHQALLNIGKRVDSPDYDLAVVAIAVNQEYGGNIIPVFESIAATVRERKNIKAEIRAMTAQGRTSAYVLAALPILVISLTFVFNPNYLAPFTTTVKGQIAMLVCFFMNFLGYLVMKKMTTVNY